MAMIPPPIPIMTIPMPAASNAAMRKPPAGTTEGMVEFTVGGSEE